MKESTKILLSSLGQAIVGAAVATVAHKTEHPIIAVFAGIFAVNGAVIGTIEATEQMKIEKCRASFNK